MLFGFKANTRITQSMRRTFKGQPALKEGIDKEEIRLVSNSLQGQDASCFDTI